MTQPLEGIRVIDMTLRVPGPWCAMMLGDMGADVIKVEELQPNAEAGSGGSKWADVHRVIERNKRSIALNLKTEDGREAFRRMAKQADVLLEGFRPGAMTRLGLDYATLSKDNPRLVYCAITGYGQTGPLRLIPGHNSNYVAMGGLNSVIRTPEGVPVMPQAPLGNFLGGLHAAYGVMCALAVRNRTGEGQYIDLAITDCVAAAMGHVASSYFSSGKVPPPDSGGNRIFETKDGRYLTVYGGDAPFWTRVCNALGLPQYVSYLREYAASPAENPKTRELLSAMRQVFMQRTQAEWVDIMWKADACVAPIQTIPETYANPQLKHREMMLEVDHPVLGKVKTVGMAIKMSKTPGSVRRLPPLRGEHTEEILRQHGYSEAELAKLRKSGAIR